MSKIDSERELNEIEYKEGNMHLMNTLEIYGAPITHNTLIETKESSQAMSSIFWKRFRIIVSLSVQSLPAIASASKLNCIVDGLHFSSPLRKRAMHSSNKASARDKRSWLLLLPHFQLNVDSKDKSEKIEIFVLVTTLYTHRLNT